MEIPTEKRLYTNILGTYKCNKILTQLRKKNQLLTAK